MIEIIDTVEKFDELQSIWERLESGPDMTVQQTFKWNRLGWDAIAGDGNSLFILKWTQDGKDDVVILPLYIDNNGTLRFIFDEQTDCCNSVYGNSVECRFWPYREAADAILAEPRIHRVRLDKMAPNSEALNYLCVFLQDSRVCKTNAYSWVCTGSEKDFIAAQKHMLSKDRKHFRYLTKKAEGLTFGVLSKRAYNPFPSEAIVQLRDYMIEQGARDKSFVNERQLRFVGAMYDAGLCEIPMLRDDSGVVALNIHFVWRDTSLAWIFLGKDMQYGTGVYVKYCADWANENAGKVDLGTGAYEYKLLTFRPFLRAVYTLEFEKTKKARISSAKCRFVASLKQLVKEIIAKG